MPAKSVKKKRAQQRAAAKRGKKPARSRRPLSDVLPPREMTLEELQEAIAPTASEVAGNTGHDDGLVRAVMTEMVETGYIGMADDGTLAMLKSLRKK